MRPYTLENDGDDLEQHYWKEFIAKKFPSYNKYWSLRICPLTNRPTNIHFKKSNELQSKGYTSDDICKAQLHYTAFRHLVSAYEIASESKSRPLNVLDTAMLAVGLFHICAAQDVAFEFLQRIATPNIYDPWAPKKGNSSTGDLASKEAREQWQKSNSFPLQNIRDYRNHLTHGRISSCIPYKTTVLVPKISKQNDYLDWRIITDGYNSSLIKNDFAPIPQILDEAWESTIQYFENEWKKIII